MTIEQIAAQKLAALHMETIKLEAALHQQVAKVASLEQQLATMQAAMDEMRAKRKEAPNAGS